MKYEFIVCNVQSIDKNTNKLVLYQQGRKDTPIKLQTSFGLILFLTDMMRRKKCRKILIFT